MKKKESSHRSCEKRSYRSKTLALLGAAVLLFNVTLQPSFAQSVTGKETKEQTPVSATQKADLLLQTYGVSGLQYALIDQGELILSETRGVFVQPMPKESLMGIGSVSKLFTAVAVMKLADEGKVNLDKPVTTYIPDFRMADERYGDITVRMLLNHSSGLMGSSLKDAFLFDDKDFLAKDTLLEQLSHQRLKAAPGAFSVYCNDGFTLAEILVEKVSGLSFTEFVHKHITEPLGMKNTVTSADKFNQARLVKTYLPGSTIATPPESVTIIGTGGIYSTAEDMCRFSRIFTSPKSSGVLTEESAALMGQPEYAKGLWATGDNLVSYGLGFDAVNIKTFSDYGIKAMSKGGDTLLYHGSLVVLPEKDMAAVVLSSGGGSPYDQLLAESLLLEALEKKGELLKKTQQEKTETETKILTSPAVAVSSDLKAKEGFYGNAMNVMKVDLSSKGALDISIPGVPNYAEHYYHQGDGLFTDETGGIKISFVEEKNQITYMKLEGTTVLSGLGSLPSSQYQCQKLSANPLSEEIAQAWAKREGKLYFAVDEKYTSQIYALGMKAYKIACTPGLPGYLGNSLIETENQTRAVLQIPGTNGRDLKEYSFYKKNGVEYLTDGSNHAVSEDGVTPIYAGSNSYCRIKDTGEAIWYKAGRAAGKTMTVTMPKEASFAVYDKNASCVLSSLASKEAKVKLPKDGMIVFAGQPGTKFEIQMK